MKKLMSLKLKMFARLIIKKYQPLVVGITGSIGKSSSKEAVYAVLKDRFSVRTSEKNYNNELGVPLTIIGAKSGGRCLWRWLLVFLRAAKLLLFRDKDYPKILILEMGVDHPGDMSYLMSIVKPQVGVVTAVSYAHLAFFGSTANIKKEKQVLIENLDKQGLAILNHDSELALAMADSSLARVISYGLKEGADLRAQDIVFNFTRGNYELSGLSCKFEYQGSIVPVFLDNIMTESALYAALAGAAVGLHFGMNLVEIAQSLKNFSLPRGRMSVLPGINHTFIIDDTYNSSPEACLAAVSILDRLVVDNNAKKIAVLGDMLELGEYSEEAHRNIGRRLASSSVNNVLVYGNYAESLIDEALSQGFSGEIKRFYSIGEISNYLKERLVAGDVVLAKGSQGMRLEKLVKEIMAEPEKASELLVRQDLDWDI
jgi:UDP-N-acetylmuramoyl-tripeptide--D-alanyl-D-alanine ligase